MWPLSDLLAPLRGVAANQRPSPSHKRFRALAGASLFFSIVLVTACSSVERDLEALCVIARDVSRLGETREGKIDLMIKRFEAAAKTEKGKKLAAALWEERMQNCYPVVVSVAREAGLEDWSCPAIAKVCTVPVE